MPEIRPARPRQVIRALERLGFVRVRQTGSHAVFKHPDGRWATVPLHHGKDIGKGLPAKIIKDAKVTPDEFQVLRQLVSATLVRRLIAEATPDELARLSLSHTGRHLKEILEQAGEAKADRAASGRAGSSPTCSLSACALDRSGAGHQVATKHPQVTRQANDQRCAQYPGRGISTERPCNGYQGAQHEGSCDCPAYCPRGDSQTHA
ncbi:MAG: addiction module toxin, HicA family [SAR202 cluster bacterium]|nr:addiction module toxin, HicA family [SAR202 cluster bacterium]